MYVLDTNFIIRYLSGDQKCVDYFKSTLIRGQIIVPTLVRSELLSSKDLSLEEYATIVSFISNTHQVVLDTDIADTAGFIRGIYNIKTPDAIIAATTIKFGATLVTANIKDFKKIKELQVIEK
jgi:predicted nucleic acid-binding protein